MNKAAKVISETLLGEYRKEVTLGKRAFSIYQPTIKEISRMFPGSELSVNENTKRFEVIAGMPEHLDDVCRALAVAITIKKPIAEGLTFRYIRRFATLEQIVKAIVTLGSVIRGDELFTYCQLDKSTEGRAAEVLGNNNLIGQVSSFMENLHLSFKEAYEELSFPLLLMMAADKMRINHGSDEPKTEVKSLSGKEMLKQKKGV